MALRGLSRIRERVMRHMGLFDNPGMSSIDKFLRREGKYPLSHAGDKTRIHIAYSGEGWGLHSVLMNELLNDHELQEAVEYHKADGRRTLTQALNEAIVERGRRGYKEEWSSLTQKQVDEVVNAASDLPNFANNTNAEKSLGIIKRQLRDWDVHKRGLYNIIDLGSAGGNTSAAILEGLDGEERKKVRFVAIDTMQKGLDAYQERFEKEGIRDDHLFTVNCEFHKISENKELEYLRFDHVVSGAALHHDPNPVQVFKGIFNKMAPGAFFNTWDWCHPAWRAENLILAPKSAVVSPDGRYYHLGRKTVEAGERHAFVSRERILGVSGSAPTEEEAVKQILVYWPGLLRIPRVKPELVKDIDQALRDGSFNFHEYVKKWEDEQPQHPKTGEKEEGYNWYLEAHPSPETRSQDLVNAGFRKIDVRLILQPEKKGTLQPSALLTHFLFQKPVRLQDMVKK